MAVTKIWRVRGKAGSVIDYADDPEKTAGKPTDEELADIADVLDYADDDEKTMSHTYTTGINCEKESAKEEFEIVKKRFGKPGGIVAIHGYQSFEEEDLSPEEVHAIGVELANKLWGDRFQVIVATHLNTDHPHNHFVINSVSFLDGKRFHMCTDRYLEMREASDEICRERGLSVIEDPKGKGVGHYLYNLEKDGMPTRFTVARAAIDEAISRSLSLEEFRHELKEMGYRFQCSQTRKNWTITLPGWQKPIRTFRLGSDYGKERLIERIYDADPEEKNENKRSAYNRRHGSYNLPTRYHRIRKKSGLERLYLRCCYELGVLPKYRQSPERVNRIFKDELLKCDLYSREARFLCETHIETDKDLLKHEKSLEGKEYSLTQERDELRKQVKRKIPDDERLACKERITELTAELKTIRKEKKLCKDIKERSGGLREKTTLIDKERNEREVRSI